MIYPCREAIDAYNLSDYTMADPEQTKILSILCALWILSLFSFLKSRTRRFLYLKIPHQNITSVFQGITCCGENICKCNLFRTNCRVNFWPLYLFAMWDFFCPTFYLPGETLFLFAVWNIKHCKLQILSLRGEILKSSGWRSFPSVKILNS